MKLVTQNNRFVEYSKMLKTFSIPMRRIHSEKTAEPTFFSQGSHIQLFAQIIGQGQT